MCMHMSMHMSVDMFIHIRPRSEACARRHLCSSATCLYTGLYMSVNVSMHMPLHIYVHVPIHMSVHTSVHTSAHTSAHMSTHMSLHREAWLRGDRKKGARSSAIRGRRWMDDYAAPGPDKNQPQAITMLGHNYTP